MSSDEVNEKNTRINEFWKTARSFNFENPQQKNDQAKQCSIKHEDSETTYSESIVSLASALGIESSHVNLAGSARVVVNLSDEDSHHKTKKSRFKIEEKSNAPTIQRPRPNHPSEIENSRSMEVNCTHAKFEENQLTIHSLFLGKEESPIVIGGDFFVNWVAPRLKMTDHKGLRYYRIPKNYGHDRLTELDIVIVDTLQIEPKNGFFCVLLKGRTQIKSFTKLKDRYLMLDHPHYESFPREYWNPDIQIFGYVIGVLGWKNLGSYYR